MKLQLKLALYNTLTKAAVIAFLGLLILFFIDKISVNHIQQRLKEKRTKLLAHLSEPEINDFLKKKGIYTDYNLLHEEYFTLKETSSLKFKKEKFSDELREIDGNAMQYHILKQDIAHNGKIYRLEFGETLAAVDQLEQVIFNFTLLVLLIAAVITVLTDLIFLKFLLAPFYKIINEKINKVNDPIHFSYTPIKTSTSDFKLLDESISMLMNKFRVFMLTQKEFIGNVSHELLTPIALISTRLENLLSEEQLSTDGENKVFANLKTLNRLKSIINSLLIISKIENDQFEKEDLISVNATITEVCEELDHRLLMQNLKISIDTPKDYIFKGNSTLFHILVTNLISNSIKYNVPDGFIYVISNYSTDSFELLIKDTGIGMTEANTQKIFKRFEKLNSDLENSYGLGLAIVKTIADFHNLPIFVHSKIGQGTEIIIQFPSS